MKTDELISLMVEDAPAREAPRRALALAILAGALVSGALFFTILGVRPDFHIAAETVRFVFKFILTLALATTAILLALRIGRPGLPLTARAIGLLLAPMLLVGAVVAELMAVPASDWHRRLVGTNAMHCLTIIPLLSLAPLAFMLVALRQGAPDNPGLAGAVAGLVSSGMAATFYASNCTDDSPLFVATWYTIAIGVVVALGYVVGKRLLRW